MKEETAVILGIAQRTLTQKEFRSLKGWLLSESIILAIFGMPLDIKDLIAKTCASDSEDLHFSYSSSFFLKHMHTIKGRALQFLVSI